MSKLTLRKHVLALLLAIGLLSGCATPASDYPREPSVAISPTEDTTLRREIDEWVASHDGPSGFYPLVSGHDAFGARLRLMDIAEKSIDIQYFLMKGDTAGQVFAASLLAAADRGVRIRFLLDDVFTTVEDEELELLDAHPNIELRLYNPIARRGIGVLNYLADFKRANRRMHNKSFTVDNQVTIVGGRNIADEYFDLRPEGQFLDLDVLGVGPVASEVSQVFDRFWNSERSLPMRALHSKFAEDDLQKARSLIDETTASVNVSVYKDAVSSTFVQDMINDRLHLHSAVGEVLTDEPEKLETSIDESQMVLVRRLAKAVSSADKEIIVFTPYFVPKKEGIEFWRGVAAGGTRVVLLTNSLASNNHAAVHAGYAKFRKPIIEAGVELYEVRVDAVDGKNAEALTLHTKGMIIDRRHAFIGSLNLDPRSIEINSEMGMLISNETMASKLAESALQRLDEIAYRVELDSRGKLQWRATIDGEEVIETKEPKSTAMQRFMAFILKIVPDSQL